MIRKAAGVAVCAVALAVVFVGCAEAQPAGDLASDTSSWDPEAFLAENTRRGAELLGIVDPPEVEVVRFVTPLEQDEVLRDCLLEAGYDFTFAPGGGLVPPQGLPNELQAGIDLAIYVCWEQYPVEAKYGAPETEERLKWMYRYQSTTMLACFAEQGYPYEGKPPSEQSYIDSEGAWSPYADLPSHDAYVVLSEKCPQTPPEYWDQPFW